MVKIKIGDIFTDQEIKRAQRICKNQAYPHFQLVDLVKKAIGRINLSTKQENDPDYLAYVLEYAVKLAQKGER